MMKATTRSASSAALAVVLSAAVVAGCSADGSSADLKGTPHGIVIDRGGVVEVLDAATTGSPHAVAGQDDDGESIDPLALTEVRQLGKGTVAGVRGGNLVVLDPAHPGKARTIAPASDWFPDATGSGGWTVTQSADASACPAIPGTSTGTIKYRLERYSLSDGKIEDSAHYLACHQRPVADTQAGLLVETLQSQVDSGSRGATVPTDLQLLDRHDFHMLKTLRSGSTFIAAANTTVVAADAQCTTQDCVKVIGLAAQDHPRIGNLPGGGTLAGGGLLDPTGRYLAAAVFQPSSSVEFVVCDVKTGSVHDLGPYTSVIPGAPRELAEDMPSVWSGDRLITVNPQTGTLSVYDAGTGKIHKRSGLTTGGNLQVWGARS